MDTKKNISAAPPNSDDAAGQSGVDEGSVVLRGEVVALHTELGAAFVIDCARHIESAVSDAEIKAKWGLSDQDWAALANNAPLLSAVQAERERRTFSGECAREAAQRHFAKADLTANASADGPHNGIQDRAEIEVIRRCSGSVATCYSRYDLNDEVDERSRQNGLDAGGAFRRRDHTPTIV